MHIVFYRKRLHRSKESLQKYQRCYSYILVFFGRTLSSPQQVFIATSNLMGVSAPSVGFFGLGNAKHNIAYFVQAGNKAYAKQGFRFYLACQVNSQGGTPGPEFSGEAHAIAYWNLIKRTERGGWDIRFTKDGSVLVEY